MTSLLQTESFSVTLADERQRALLLARRQALLIELGAIEEYLQIKRSVPTKKEREYLDWQQRQSD